MTRAACLHCRLDDDRATLARLPLARLLLVLLTAATVGTSRAAPPASGQPDTPLVASFDPAMLADGPNSNVNLQRFEQGITLLPGLYNVDIYRNQQWLGRSNVRLSSLTANTNAVPCMTPTLLQQLQLTEKVTQENRQLLQQPDGCPQLAELVPGTSIHFDLAKLRLEAGVPQALLGSTPRGYVPASSWDAGIPASLTNYRFNVYRASGTVGQTTSTFLALNTGLNLNKWYFRQESTASWQDSNVTQPAQHHWNNLNTYVRRDLPALRSQLTLGDSHTDGAVFDSFSLRGAQLASDDRMLPRSQRGYAPVIHGNAYTNAKVSIRQNGIELMETTVPPGPFVIDDIYPTGYGGDLDVTVTEADGRIHNFKVPYASVAQLQRTGISRYGLAIGRLRNSLFGNQARVLQATLQRGFSNLLTGYGGLQLADGYAAELAGVALNTRAGAFAADLTQANTHVPGGQNLDGQSLRLTWSKLLIQTGTHVSIAAYRYSTSGFLALEDAENWRYQVRHDTGFGTYPDELLRQRNRFSLSLAQPLAGKGQLYANAIFRNYWNQSRADTTYQLGYSHYYQQLNYGLNLARTSDYAGRHDFQVSLNLSLPLGQAPHTPNLMANLSDDSNDSAQQQLILTGTSGHDHQMNYSASLTHAEGAGSSATVATHYHASWVDLGASIGHGENYSQLGASANGALLIHAGGVTFGQPTGDTVALVHAPGASGAKVGNLPGVRVDAKGYALVPYLVPYQMNSVQLGADGLPLNTVLDASSVAVAPYAGAIVKAEFKTHYGLALLATLHDSKGDKLPFGTIVKDDSGKNVGVVGQGGHALLRLHTPVGQLTAELPGDNTSPASSCRFNYHLSTQDKSAKMSLPRLNATCVAAVIQSIPGES